MSFDRVDFRYCEDGASIQPEGVQKGKTDGQVQKQI
jgi:hypothetical protein